jgi:hypothetical protein
MAGLVRLVPAISMGTGTALCMGSPDKPGDDILGWFDVIGTCL